MARIHKLTCAAIILGILFSGQDIVYAQDTRASRDQSTRETDVPRAPSGRGNIALILAEAVIRALCERYGNCNSNTNAPVETTEPRSGLDRKYMTPELVGPNNRSAPPPRGFSFDTPPGWQSYDNQSAVTIARPSEYTNGNLVNGVILGLFELNGGSYESGNEKYVRQLRSNNKYLKRVGWPESNVVNNVACMTTRMEGQSPQTHYFEKVVVYTCKRNAQQLFYVVTVNSGPNANRYEEENNRITQSISFR